MQRSDIAVANFPAERFTLRNGALLIREHNPGADEKHPSPLLVLHPA